MRKTVRDAIRGNAPRTPAFDAGANALADGLGELLGAPVIHDRGPQYGHADVLTVCASAHGRPRGCGAAGERYRVRAYLSWLGPYFTTLILERESAGPAPRHAVPHGSSAWSLAKRTTAPEAVVRLAGQIDDYLTAHGLTRVDEDDLWEPVKGQVTELLGEPATLMDALFSEFV